MHPLISLRCGGLFTIVLNASLALSLRAAPVINEIHYHPLHAETSPEPLTEEWVEIHNPDAAEADVSGWAFTRGVSFVIPPGTVIPAGGYLVVAANVATFNAAHPGFSGALTGGWTGQLSNSGEALKLVDAGGAEVDTVDYADEGDWAIRGRGAVVAAWGSHQGWDWFTDADGLGKTKELANPALRKNTGQNWKDSAAAGGTPGAVNSAAAANVAPVILAAKHRPQVPRATEAVAVSCKVTDDNAAAVSATLRWRLDGAGAFSSLTMSDADADGEFTATIPAQANLTVVEWYVSVSDGTRTRTWPPAARTSNPGVLPETYAQLCNALYQVDDSFDATVPWTAGAQPVYRLILTAAERAELREIGEIDDNQNAQIDAAMNGTFIATDGTGQDTRYRASVRNRGFSSRNGPPNNFSLSFVAGEEWEGRGSFQLNCLFPHSAVCAAAIFTLGGVAVQDAAPAQFRINGLNPATSGQGVGTFTQSITFNTLARVEALGGDWAANHFPADADGNLYRVDDHDVGNSTSNDFRYPGSANPDLYDDIYRKQTNQDLNDYTDLAALFQALNAGGDSTTFTAGVKAQANVDQWMTYIALDSLVGNREGGLTTGRSDDFSMYRGLTDQRFVLVPHDFDTTLGQGIPADGVTRSIFSHIEQGFSGLVRMFNEPEFLHLYYRKNVELLDSVFTNARLDPLFDELMSPWVGAGTISGMKNFVTQRRTNVFNQIPRVNLFEAAGVTTGNPTLIDGMKQTPDGAATFGGQFNVAAVQSVLLNGQAAALQWRTTTNPPATAGRWTLAATTANGFLKKGTNRVRADYYSGPNGTGSIVYSTTVDVYNAAGAATTVNANGTTSTNSLFVKAPASYVPGIPFLVEVEYRDSSGAPDLFAWNRTATLTASNGVTLTSASTGGGAASVPLYNGRGSLLVQAAGTGTGATSVLLRGRGSSGTGTVVTWNYYQTSATPPPATWRETNFTPATGWLSGPPIFHRNEATLDGAQGTQLTAPTISHAFRTQFTVSNPSQYASAKIRLQRDDGAIIHFNGNFLGVTPGVTQGMAWNAVSTTAILAAAEPTWLEFDVPVAQIIDGVNTIAVEIHQATPAGGTAASGDMRFDCEMTGTTTGGGATDPGNFTLTATADSLVATKAVTSLTPAPAMTNKSGILPGSETWSGVINVTADVTVPAGSTLTISPGTHVLMAGTAFGGGGTAGAKLIVNGSLAANGTEANPVSITCSDAANRWGEINFATATASTMQHCLVSRACHSPGGGHTGTGPMLRLAGTTLTVDDCILSDSPGKTMTNTGNANLTVRRSIFSRCVMGPELNTCAINIQDSLLTDMLPAHRESGAADDEDCIYINAPSVPALLQRSVFANCGDDVLDFLGGTITVEDCIIRNGFDKGISALGNHIAVRRCLIVDNDIGISAKITAGQVATEFTNTIENCTIVCENHPLNTGDGTFHSIGLHTRNKNNTASANIVWNVRNTIISAEEPVANDYPAVGSTVFGGMNFSYSCYQDLGGANPANATPAGTGNISSDPLFTSAAGKNFRLQATSPCRDTGDPLLTDADATRSDMGCYPYNAGGGGSPTSIIWSLAGSPYRVPQNTTIPAGTTLTVEAGVSVFFDQNVRLTVNGRINAIGTKDARIRFSHVPSTNLATDVDPIKNGAQTGAPKWGGIRVVGSLAQENAFRYCDFLNAQGTDPATSENWGSLGFIRSWGWADNLTFAGTHLRMCYGRNCKLTVTHCDFPNMFQGNESPTQDFLPTADNRMEPLKVEYPTTDTELAGQTGAGGAFPNGLPRNGHWRCWYNDFHGNRGHQDVFDADSGRWAPTDAGTGFQTNGQFMLDCRYNTFHGITGDEHIDLGGDAFIADNRFYSGSKDQWTIDRGYSNAISSGDKGTGTTIVVARNVFYDLDHAINCKVNTATIFEHNTCVDFHQDWDYDHTEQQDVRCAAVNLFVPNDVPPTAAGDGGYVAYNIFYGNSVAPDDTVNPDPVGGFPRIFSWPDVTTTGAKTSIIRVENNFIDDRILDTSLGANHPGGLFAPAWGFGNVQGNPLIADKANKDFSLLPNSPAKGTAAGGLDYGATVGEWTYILGAPPAQTAGTGATLTVGGPGIVAYKWRLDSGAWSAPIQIGDGGVMSRTGPIVRQGTITLTGLTNGPHTVEVLGQDMAGNWQDADPAKTIEGLPQFLPTTAAWTVDTSLQLVRLNEIAAHTADGNDWVELYNAGATPLDIGGWILAEDATGTDAVVIPWPTMIPSGGTVVIGSAATPLSFDKDGDSVFLLDSGSVVKDSITFGTQPLGYTLGRTGLAATWGLCVPTSNAVNVPAGISTSTTGLRITEVFASAVISFKDDWVEICNTSTLPVELSGLRLSDNRAGTTGSVIPPYSYVGPNACAVFLADNTDPPAGNHLPFRLDAQQESIALLTAAGAVIDEVLLFPQTDDWSQTRTASGGTAWAELSTRGFTMLPTDPAYLNALAVMRGLRITEIMYNAQGGSNFDWLELRNTGTTAINLNGVNFDQGITFTFGNVTLDPGQNIILAKHLASFQGRYGAVPNVGGIYAGNLDNGGETLALRLAPPFDANVLWFAYGDAWYPSTDGGGRSLVLNSTATNRQDFGDSASWNESAQIGGSPDGITAPEPTTYPAWLSYYATADGLDSDFDGLTSLAEFGLGLDPQRPGGLNGIAQAPTGAVAADKSIHLSFSLPENPAAPGGHGRAEVTYQVQVSSDLQPAAWSTIATKSPSTNWTGPVTNGPAIGGFVPVTVTDTVTVTATRRRFLRLQMTWTP